MIARTEFKVQSMKVDITVCHLPLAVFGPEGSGTDYVGGPNLVIHLSFSIILFPNDTAFRPVRCYPER